MYTITHDCGPKSDLVGALGDRLGNGFLMHGNREIIHIVSTFSIISGWLRLVSCYMYRTVKAVHVSVNESERIGTAG